MQIGRRIYYEKATGNVVLDTGERTGDVVPTTVDQDFEIYQVLKERVRDAIGVIQLEYGQYAQDFMECSGFRVDVNGQEPMLVFSYPDPNQPEAPPIYRPALSEQVTVLEEESALLALELAQTQARLEQTEQEHADLLLMLVSQGVI